MGSGDAGNQGLFGSTMQTTTVSPTAAASNAGGTPAGTAAVTPGDFDASQFTCPPIQVRGGAAAWQVTDPQDGGVRYQATLGQFSRECRFTAPDMNIRVGIQGRVLLGAKGGPGKVNVPIRLAVVEEGPEPKSVWTKFYSVPVEIGAGVMQVDFGIVADDVNFPRPTPAVSERYVIYVGFDPQGAGEAAAPAASGHPGASAAAEPARRAAAGPASAPGGARRHRGAGSGADRGSCRRPRDPHRAGHSGPGGARRFGSCRDAVGADHRAGRQRPGGQAGRHPDAVDRRARALDRRLLAIARERHATRRLTPRRNGPCGCGGPPSTPSA